MSIAENLQQVQARIAAACASSGRDPTTVRLLAASKSVDVPRIQEAMASGHQLFGESRAQVLRDKGRALEGQDIEWHFIGNLQRNKVKYVAGRASLVHSVSSASIAAKIAEHNCNKPQGIQTDVLVQVEFGKGLFRTGCGAEQALELAQEIHAMPNVGVRGLMTLPPFTAAVEESEAWFVQLAALAEKGREAGLPLIELSMGMSRDLEYAIAHGATIVRIGTAIFGARR